jgi:flagellin-specific chaperone FliS
LGKLYLKDCWNTFDLIIILLSLAFVFLDIYTDNSALDGFLKIRGIFRLLRIFLLIRKLDALRIKREFQKRKMISMGYDLRAPLEKVLEILNQLRDQIDTEEDKVIKDLNYCIKMISSNQLYEAKLEIDPESNDKDKENLLMLMNTYSKVADRDHARIQIQQ